MGMLWSDVDHRQFSLATMWRTDFRGAIIEARRLIRRLWLQFSKNDGRTNPEEI